MQWYADVANLLATGKLPKHMTPRERKLIVQRSTRFSWIRGYLFHIGANMHIHRCIREDKIYDILKACHDGPCSGHFADSRTGHKFLQMGYYWPTIFKDAKKFVETCDSCQRMGRLGQSDEIPLHPRLVIEPFEHWALDFVGLFKPPSNQKKYILVATYYEPIFPIEFEIQTLKTTQEIGLDLTEARVNRLQQMNELDEIRLLALQCTTLIQWQRAKWHDALTKKTTFHEGDWALLYDSKFQDFLGKLQPRWLGPYEIKQVHDNDTLMLATIDGSGSSFKANGY
eukprot:PITA_09166